MSGQLFTGNEALNMAFSPSLSLAAPVATIILTSTSKMGATTAQQQIRLTKN